MRPLTGCYFGPSLPVKPVQALMLLVQLARLLLNHLPWFAAPEMWSSGRHPDLTLRRGASGTSELYHIFHICIY